MDAMAATAAATAAALGGEISMTNKTRRRRIFAARPSNASPKSGNQALCCSKSSPTYIQEFESRSSADEVRREILSCYDLVHKLGRGAVYLGSARTKPDHPHFLQAMELGREVALLLDCTSWCGAGPGLMDAATKGALEAGKPVGGFRIHNEGGVWTNTLSHPYMVSGTYLTCRFFSARKHGLVDAGVRNAPSDRTAFLALPGGVGSLDEIFEVLTLIQLRRIGSSFPVPFLLINYDGFYDHLLEFLATCREWGTVAEGEVEALWRVCRNNSEALDYLAEFYGISDRKSSMRSFENSLQS
ncbi:probable cytokinin riboside 5'-monophosphate phosphoribohydrolase LOGL10 [Selaginella moellendorffii]|uniref:probable cytokinin riboside 5'-monophosphate phosphoribohydrolase LOGL10 n=1 Tax=Selaginella moellendorffii TaxID=88036 RepID=UPI000D1CF42B|nr:probable cytokinin riboside 5'-monophosphate phosphoribohydrolase LOGL10 [Selaginella moellendorffii]|eukprot:XP_002981164.2 probable cytokinin riboside 5'-monophosphate phosphoribohydrolase LOGL10 [Selaginella moellendorffii]